MSLTERFGDGRELLDQLGAMIRSDGLSDLLAGFNDAGEESQVESWVGSIANEPTDASAVKRAIGEGRITSRGREKWLASARADLATAERLMMARPAMARPITARAGSSGGIVTSTVQSYSDDEIHLAAMMRSGGIAEDQIKATIARKRGQVV